MSKAGLVAFYSGHSPDDRGRFLREILAFSDVELETVHDYIQWLFPLDEPSRFNPSAPLLTPEIMAEFRKRADLANNLRQSFERMVRFYGFAVEKHDDVRVSRASDFEAKSLLWLTPYNHNHLRITRIIRSLRLLGLEREAQALFHCLRSIYEEEIRLPQPRITPETFAFWSTAARSPVPTP